jgi:hypothetical protein
MWMEIKRFVELYKDESSYYYIEKKPFVTTFGGDGLDFDSLSLDMFLVVNLFQTTGNQESIDGYFAWPPSPFEKQNQEEYLLHLSKSQGKLFMTYNTASFYTNQPGKNYYKEFHIVDRWKWIFENQVQMVELVSWNDFTESTHVFDPIENVSQSVPTHSWNYNLNHSLFMPLHHHFICTFLGNPFVGPERIWIWFNSKQIHLYGYFAKNVFLNLETKRWWNSTEKEWNRLDLEFSVGTIQIEELVWNITDVGLEYHVNYHIF